jgi:hypothetical protein
MKKHILLTLVFVGILIIIGLCCEAQSARNKKANEAITLDLLLKNKFHFENALEELTLSFKNDSVFTFAYSSKAIEWDEGFNEGTFEIKNGKLLMHAKDCVKGGDLIDCKEVMDEAEGTLLDSANTKYLAIRSLSKPGTFDLFSRYIKFPVIDKNFNVCAEIVKEHSKTLAESSKIIGKWASEDGNIVYEFKENEYTCTRTEVNSDATFTNNSQGTYKISNVIMPHECFRNEQIKGLKNGIYINLYNQIYISFAKYYIDENTLILQWENSKKDILKKR